MSMKRSAAGISCDDRRIFRLWKIVRSEGRSALHYVFKWGCKKSPRKSLKDYLTKEKGMSNTKYSNTFYNNMRETIEKDTCGDTYDVSLLYACIKVGCDLPQGPHWEKGNDNLESLCTTVKDYRNHIVHEDKIICDADMNKWCKDYTDTLEKLLRSAGNKYGVSVSEVQKTVDETNLHINKIMTAPLGDDDCRKLSEEILNFRKEIKEAILNERSMLAERYKNMSKLDPASFVTGEERMHVKNVFTMLEVVCKEKENASYDVGYNDLLEVRTEGGEKPKIIIVEGDAGAGKTTLTKLILSDWSEGNSIFNELNNYDLLLRGEGKNKSVSSFLQLIQILMPTASYTCSDDELVRSVLRLNVLLVMDGFDELNETSQKLIQEILEKHMPESDGKLRLLITTRPSKMGDLCRILPDAPHYSRVNTRIKGISRDNRVEFVTKLHDEMKRKGQSKQETHILVDFMKSQSLLGEHFRMPLNLTLLTYLWASDPGKVNPQTTATGLYIAILELIQSRLRARLQAKLGVVSLPNHEGEKAISKFLGELYSVSLKTLSSDSMQLSDESTEALRDKCAHLKLPFDDVTEAFLVVEKDWTSTGDKTYLTVPHKSILEFFAANQLMMYIKNKNYRLSMIQELKSILEKLDVTKEKMEMIMSIVNEDSEFEEGKLLKKILQDHLGTHLEKYDNMFLHMTGLLAHQCPHSLQEYSEELVEILKLASFKGTKWLDLLVESQYDEKLARLLAPLSSPLIVHDGHIKAALVLFRSLDTDTKVNIILENEVADAPQLEDMLLQLSKRDCEVELTLKHHWKHTESDFSDQVLNKLLSGDDHRCRLTKFTGHLKTLSCLPATLTKLRITLATNESAKKLLEELSDYEKRSNIKVFGVHVMSGIMAEGLPPLPILKHEKKECGTLWLSKVTDDLLAKCKVIRALLPKGGIFNSIFFPQSNFSKDQCEMILNELKRLRVKVGKKGGIRFSSNTIKKDQLPGLKEFAMQTLDCALYCTNDESRMW